MRGTWYPSRITGWTVSAFGKATYDKAYLTFGDEEWQAGDGCNEQRGTYHLEADGTFEMTSGASTEIGCANVPHVDVMESSTRLQVVGRTLVFSAPGRSPEEIARYTRTVSEPETATTASAVDEVRKKSEPAVPPPP